MTDDYVRLDCGLVYEDAEFKKGYEQGYADGKKAAKDLNPETGKSYKYDKWICNCKAINAAFASVCHSCGKEYWDI